MSDTPENCSAKIVEFKRPTNEPQPDPQFVAIVPTSGKAVKWFKFACCFTIDGGEYGFDIWAIDKDDAERRVKAVRETATVRGQLYSEVPL